MKIKWAAFLAVAKGRYGYAGSDTDPEAVRAHLVAQKAKLTDAAGKAVNLATLEILDGPAGDSNVAVAIEDEPTGTVATKAIGPSTSAVDIQALISAGVEVAMKAAGFDAAKGLRPGSLSTHAGSTITVKSPAERMYEDKAKRGQASFETYDQAYGMQQWLGMQIGLCTHRPDVYEKKRKSWGEWIATKAYSTTSSTGGSALVPEIFVPDLIRNVLQYGVARQLSKVITMPGESIVIPRRTGGLTGSYPLQNVAGTSTNATYDNVSLNAKTFVVLAQASQQILDDSAVGLVDLTMDELALAIATQEDNNLFIGDGSATYGGCTGFTSKYGTTATDGGYNVVGGGTALLHSIANIVSAIGRVPQYARRNMVITCSPTLSANIFYRLSTSTGVGGLTLSELVGVGPVFRFMGVPIVENNSMASLTDASGAAIDFLIGDFSRAALFGDRLGVELAMSTERGFDAYSVYFRGVARHDMVVHSVGNSTTAGPVVAFWQS